MRVTGDLSSRHSYSKLKLLKLLDSSIPTATVTRERFFSEFWRGFSILQALLPYFPAASVQLTCLFVDFNFFLTKMDVLHHCQCQLYLSKKSTRVCSTGAWWVIRKYVSHIQSRLSFVFLSEPFGGDNVSEGKTCSSKKSVLVMEDSPHLDATLEMGGRGEEKNASFGMVIADITTVYFPRLLCVSVF